MWLLHHLGALAALMHDVDAGRQTLQTVAHLHAIHVIHIHGQCVVQLIDAHFLNAVSLSKVGLDIVEVLPLARRLVCTQIFGQHMQGPVFGHIIKDIAAHTDLRRIGIGINPLQAAATEEHPHADGGDGARNGDARQAGAIGERPPADGGDRARDGDARQARAIFEGTLADGGDGK